MTDSASQRNMSQPSGAPSWCLWKQKGNSLLMLHSSTQTKRGKKEIELQNPTKLNTFAHCLKTLVSKVNFSPINVFFCEIVLRKQMNMILWSEFTAQSVSQFRVNKLTSRRVHISRRPASNSVQCERAFTAPSLTLRPLTRDECGVVIAFVKLAVFSIEIYCKRNSHQWPPCRSEC